MNVTVLYRIDCDRSMARFDRVEVVLDVFARTLLNAAGAGLGEAVKSALYSIRLQLRQKWLPLNLFERSFAADIVQLRDTSPAIPIPRPD